MCVVSVLCNSCTLKSFVNSGDRKYDDSLLRHGRDVHPAWVNVVTTVLALKSFGGQVMRAEVMLESREGSGF
jgi:hypothetical protein